ncbi:hypothetical protein [Microbacterium halotolerans]|uniref:hypothetical protein n=1 Tax=Microbacterium halotolerans TaxID=246613 RepID=UPI000E6AD0C6|nr:hypothetical protein [Microbacterium halotolerans]
MRHTTAAAIGLVWLGAALVGCSGTGGFADLERDPSPADEIPLSDSELRIVDRDTARYIDEHDGTDLWLARSLEDGICLITYADESAWVVGCGGSDGPVGVGGMAGRFEAVPGGGTPPESGTQLSENVWALHSEG